ncbi:MAG: tryptophan--tRNA ligase [Chlamydiae bacterium SM23_39]|nr:MAG: tryptophan--tRNA ligase [Chlamydiae bacterium SM23_39]
MEKKIILTADRPTGRLHLGHYIGSLKNRVELQDSYDQYVMIADLQALTDHAEKSSEITNNILEVAIDYLSCGIDPVKTTIFVQSKIPQLSELTMYFLNLVTINRLKHNPTVKAEIKQKNFKEAIPAGFLIYPVSQAADITAFKADLVPVGDDQLPMIEQTVEIVRKFNRIYKKVLIEPKALISKMSRLPGIDGKAKMSKTLKNAIFLSDEEDVVSKKVMSMFTDPDHLKIEDPGKVEGNPVFIYLDAFCKNRNIVDEMKEHYRKGGLGDVKVKKYLLNVLLEFLTPIRKKRKELEKDKGYILKILQEGIIKAELKAKKTLKEVKEAMSLF